MPPKPAVTPKLSAAYEALEARGEESRGDMIARAVELGNKHEFSSRQIETLTGLDRSTFRDFLTKSDRTGGALEAESIRTLMDGFNAGDIHGAILECLYQGTGAQTIATLIGVPKHYIYNLKARSNNE